MTPEKLKRRLHKTKYIGGVTPYLREYHIVKCPICNDMFTYSIIYKNSCPNCKEDK